MTEATAYDLAMRLTEAFPQPLPTQELEVIMEGLGKGMVLVNRAMEWALIAG